MFAGFIAALVTSPVDVVKSRIMNENLGNGTNYRGTWDCIQKAVRTEGLLGLYKGFLPNWMRIGPHTVVVSQNGSINSVHMIFDI
jgi:hypothetical protein